MTITHQQIVYRKTLGGGDFPALRFKRVTSGEYAARLSYGWTYTAWRGGSDCPDCSHSHDYWELEWWSAESGRQALGRHRTLTDARISAAQHAVDAGVLES